MPKSLPGGIQPNDLRLFLEVAELGSFTKAAARRRTVQSRISKQIAALEQACGGLLFRRTGRGVVPTELGKRVQARVRKWLSDTDQFFNDIRADSQVPMGEVRLAILPSAAHPLLTNVCHRLRLGYPGIRLDIREGQGSELDTLLDSGSVDMAILFRHQRPTGDERWLATAETYLVSQPGDPLTRAGTLDFARLAGVPLILPRRPAHWRSVLDDTARAKGFALSAELEADSLRVQKEMVVLTPGLYAVLGAFSIDEELRAGRLQAARIINPELKRHVTLAMPSQGQLTPACKIVAGLIRDTVAAWDHHLTAPEQPQHR